MPHRTTVHSLVLAALLAAACNPGRKAPAVASKPRPSPAGLPTGRVSHLAIDGLGGLVVSPDGRLTLTVPPGAVAAGVDFTIGEITNTAPGGVGVAYRLGPSGLAFAVPVVLTFGAAAAPAPVDGLAIAVQDAPTGWWVRPQGITRDAGTTTLAVAADHFSDWALVTATTARDLAGTLTLDSTLTDRPPFHVTGQATLAYAGEGDDRGYYIQGGTLTVSSPLASGAATCTPAAATVPDAANLAEARWSAGRLDWGVSGHWDLACTGGTGPATELLIASFDTVGLNLIGCSRSYLAPPLLGVDRLQGSYAIDCGAGGRLTGTWDFVAGSCGGPCTTQPDQVCHVGIVDCTTGAQRCVNGAAVADGTACSDGDACSRTDTCQAGTCTGGNPVVCAPLDACHAAGTCNPLTGLCSNPARPDGTACSDANVCTLVDACAAGVCVGTGPMTCVASDACHLPGSCDPVTGCSNPAAPDGTTCSDANACTLGDACQAGVCAPVSIITCTAADQCHAAGTCDTGTGTCSSPPLDGTPCSDGNACTLADTCVAGTCTGGSPVTCTAADACHLAGVCNPATGACSSPTQPDGTPCGGGLTCLGGACAARTVTGNRLVTFWPDGGALAPAVPADVLVPPLATVGAFAADGGGGVVLLPGTLAADGSYAIPNVPAGTFLLVVADGGGQVRLVATSASAVDLGFDRLGRPDAAPATLQTDVTWSLAGLDPWDPAGDQVQVVSSNAGVRDVAASGAQLAAGHTFGSVVENWAASPVGVAQTLLGAGDAVWAHHLAARPTDAPGITCRAAAHGLLLASAALADGQAATLPVDFTGSTLVAVPFTGSVAVQWDLPAFEALLPAMGPGAAPVASAHALRVGASPHALTAPAPVSRAGSPDLLLLEVPAGTPALDLGALAYGQYLPSPLWAEWRGASFTAAVSYLAPGATVPVGVATSAGRREPMIPPPPAPIAPAIGPPRSLTLGGLDATGALSGVGTVPVLAWMPPATGAASRYAVEILQLTLAAGTDSAVSRVATLVTGATAVTLPPGLLQAGGTYLARVTARAESPDAFDTAPMREAVTGSWASALTAPFAP